MHAIASRLCWVKLEALYYVHRRSEAWVRAIREKLVFCPFRRFYLVVVDIYLSSNFV